MPTADTHLIRLKDEIEDGHYMIRAELPGIDPVKDIDVTLTDGQLTIKAELRLVSPLGDAARRRR